MIVSKPRHHALAIALVTALCSAQYASAQEAAPAPQEEPTTLAALTVTAQKREQRLQEVPIVVNVLNEQLLQDTGVRDIKDLQVLVPGLTVTSTQSAAQTTARIRGVGTVGDNPGLESSVGIVIDGVYRARNSVGFTDLGELERIEVLKGPQGTVFGKNTSAGVINVVSRRPGYTQELEGELTIGNYGAVGLAASFNDALSDNAAFRIYAAKRKRDGVDEVNTGVGPRAERDDGDQNMHTVRGQLLLEPTDTLSINLSADYASREENCCVSITTHLGPTAAILNALAGGNGLGPVDLEARTAYANRTTEQDLKDKGISAEVNWDMPWLGNARLTSITAQRSWDAITSIDFDYSGADIMYRPPEADASLAAFDNFSQELRLTGSTDKVDWMVGLFYADEDLVRNDSYYFGNGYEPYMSTLVASQVLAGVGQALATNPQLAPLGLTVNAANPATFFSQVTGRPFGTNFTGVGALDNYKQNAKSTALFTNNTFHVSDKLDLTVGLRYTHEKKTLDARFSNPNGSLACGTALSNPGARVGGALAQRIVGLANLPGPVQQAVLGAIVPSVAPSVVGFMCLPWANAAHNGRHTEQSRTEKEWSGTVKAAYNWSEEVMTYFSAARGYKAGGFNLDRVQSSNGLSSGTGGIIPVDDTSFPGEFVDSYEVGAKTTWADGNLLFNAAIFHQKYTDFQLNSFLGTAFVVRSIPEVTSQGFEVDLLWNTQITGLSLQGGLTYADTKYGDDLLPDADLALLPGNQMSFAPEWSGNLSVSYDWDIGSSLMGRFNIGGKYMSDYNTGSDLDPQKQQDAYTLLNARIGIGRQDRRWMLELWANNLTNETYKQVGIDAPIQAGTWNTFLGAPRMYGMTLRMRY